MASRGKVEVGVEIETHTHTKERVEFKTLMVMNQNFVNMLSNICRSRCGNWDFFTLVDRIMTFWEWEL